jgi:hypothetical protein
MSSFVPARGALLVYLPAYGYELQPAQKSIYHARLWLLRHRELLELNSRLAIRRAFRSVTASDSAGYFRSGGFPVEELVEGVHQ